MNHPAGREVPGEIESDVIGPPVVSRSNVARRRILSIYLFDTWDSGSGNSAPPLLRSLEETEFRGSQGRIQWDDESRDNCVGRVRAMHRRISSRAAWWGGWTGRWPLIMTNNRAVRGTRTRITVFKFWRLVFCADRPVDKDPLHTREG